MGDMINLRRARKTKARMNAAQLAEQNRLSFGRTKSERTLTQARAQQDKERLDQHRLSSAADQDTPPRT
jgi:Domain of unknown function (DUF4169)